MKQKLTRMARKRLQQQNRPEQQRQLQSYGDAILKFLPATSTRAMERHEIEFELAHRGYGASSLTAALDMLQRERKIEVSQDIRNRKVVEVWHKRR